MQNRMDMQAFILRKKKVETFIFNGMDFCRQGGSLGSFSSEICRLLQLYEEEDDATSSLAAPKPEPDVPKGVNGFTSQEVSVLLLCLVLSIVYLFDMERLHMFLVGLRKSSRRICY